MSYYSSCRPSRSLADRANDVTQPTRRPRITTANVLQPVVSAQCAATGWPGSASKLATFATRAARTYALADASLFTTTALELSLSIIQLCLAPHLSLMRTTRNNSCAGRVPAVRP